MVATYTRKSTRQGWDATSMEKAIEAVRLGRMTLSKAASAFGVPRTTLRRRFENKNLRASGNIKCLGRFKTVFSVEQEQEMVNHILNMEVRFYGVTIKDLQCLAYQLAEKNKIKHSFNSGKMMAGKDWIKGFRKRHPELSIRKPEATSTARAQAFNKPNVMKFYNLLQDVQAKHNFPPHRVFNVDETGLTTVQSKSSKVFALKGRRQVGAMTSAERGVLSTFAICMSAGGSFVPPLVIFARKRMKPELTDGAPPGTVFSCFPTGWMQTEIFNDWYDHFLRHTKPTAGDPVLLVLDGHYTHTKNVMFLEKAKQNHTTVLCLPPHCSHKLQPLDVSFMNPLNTFFVQAVEKYLRNNPGRAISQYQISSLFGEAYLRAAVPNTAINGFRSCGIVPLNPDVYGEADFAPSESTDRPMESSVSTAEEPPTSPPLSTVEKPATSPPPIYIEEVTVEVSSSPIISIDVDQPTVQCNEEATSSFNFSPTDILPVPKAQVQPIRKTGPKKGSSGILTTSPYIDELKKSRTKIPPQPKPRKKKSSRPRTLFPETSAASDSVGNDSECFYCNEMYSKSKSREGWIRCSECHKWAHDECAGVEDDDDDFQCEICLARRLTKNRT